MRVLGLNKGVSCSGKSLADGAVAYLEDGELKALIMEERVTGILRKGGFDDAFALLKRKFSIDIDGIDHVGVSTCTEPVDNSSIGLGKEFEAHKSVHKIPHHLSHAYGTFRMSGFDEALVVVIDGGGNIITNSPASKNDFGANVHYTVAENVLTNSPASKKSNNPNWWEEPREQHSYYVASKNGIELVSRDFDEPKNLGFGELYRAATYLLGFNTSRKAANIMALASYGDYHQVPLEPFVRVEKGKMISELEYQYDDPYKSFDLLFNDKFRLSPELSSVWLITRDNKYKPYWDFCAYIQRNIEQAILEKLRYLKAETHAKNLCITGGTALNCVMNAKIQESGLFEKVYVPFVPGDHGQSLGNAFVVDSMFRKGGIQSFSNTQDAFLGVDDAHEEQIDSILSGKDELKFVATDNVEKCVATLLNKKLVVLTCIGKSEAGYRALGNRSILSNARNGKTLERNGSVQVTKAREWFRPYAPAILSSYYEQISGHKKVESPFMSFAVNIKGRARCFGKCKSNDKRARIQTVDEKSFVGKVLLEMQKLGNNPVCLNTSLNFPGKPIVESLREAVAFLERANIDVLATDVGIVYKKSKRKIRALLAHGLKADR